MSFGRGIDVVSRRREGGHETCGDRVSNCTLKQHKASYSRLERVFVGQEVLELAVRAAQLEANAPQRRPQSTATPPGSENSAPIHGETEKEVTPGGGEAGAGLSSHHRENR